MPTPVNLLRLPALGVFCAAVLGCSSQHLQSLAAVPVDDLSVAALPSAAASADGLFVSWREHIVDDSAVAGLSITGSDGLAMADIDGDGFEDIVSVHESDTVYDGKPEGLVRIAWGSNDPDVWQLGTLASGADAAAAEDVSLGDVNGDGHIDVVVACELAHLIYLQNPGATAARAAQWPKAILANTQNRGSYIRAFLADFDGDGKLEVSAANKGAQSPELEGAPLNAISIYRPSADPLQATQWQELELGRVRVPINAQPVDIDQDGDLDVVGGSRGEARLVLYENQGAMNFAEQPILVTGSALPINSPLRRPPYDNNAQPGITGFNMDFADLDADGRTDIVLNEWPNHLVWLRQPERLDDEWQLSVIGEMAPDMLVSVVLADIDSDGDLDAFAGSYSRGPRDKDGEEVNRNSPAGRISWFENPQVHQRNEMSGAKDTVLAKPWRRHDVSRRKRGMYDKWIVRDLDGDGDLDMIGTRGNSEPFDGVIWLEQVRTKTPRPSFQAARLEDSARLPLPLPSSTPASSP